MKRKLDESIVKESSDVDDQKENTEIDEVPKKVAKKSKHGAHDFSSQEISRLKETEALFHSSLFRLQVSELLKEVSVRLKLKTRLEEATEALSKMLKGFPPGKVHKITDRKWLESKGVKIPLMERPKTVKGTFQFLPPSDVRLSGSCMLNTAVKPDVVADLFVEMPKESFNPKDYLNQRYTRKRALYLAAIASRLNKKKIVEDLKFTYLLGNPHKPVLLVKIKGHDSKTVRLCMHAIPEKETFKLPRFHVTKNNIRPNWFFNKTDCVEDQDSTSLPATPYYNSSILHDLCSPENDRFIEKMLKGSQGLVHGIMLLKIWLRKRDLLQGVGAFTSYLITAYVVYLLMMKKLNKLMTSYQVFRTTLLYLSRADWTSEPPSLFQDKPEKTRPTVQEFRDSALCVFVDVTGYFNIAYMLTVSAFARVKDEARLAIEALDHCHQNSFDVLFATPVTFACKFDHIFHINVTPDILETVSRKVENLAQKEMDVGGHVQLLVSQHIYLQLHKALGKRIHLIQAKAFMCNNWEISAEPFSHNKVACLTFGLMLDASNAFNILDKGPQADSAEAKEFRDFWGKRSEMRRFKDGTIHEAILWTSSECQSDRRLVCKNIVHYVLHRHCGISKTCIHYMAGGLDPLLHLTLLPKDGSDQYGTGEEQSLAILRAYDHVNRAVRALTTLPLNIHSIQGIHPVFRHADVFPALPAGRVKDEAIIVSEHVVLQDGKPLPQYVPALTVVCTLEGSGKWPEEIEAIRCLKALFHIKMGKELKEKHLLPVNIFKSHVDVVKDGYVFRLKIANTRELAVLRTVKTDNGMVKFKETEESAMLEKEIVTLPVLTSLLHGLQQEHPAYSSTVRLCKRWVASQMVWNLVHEEAIELIVANMFISPYPYTAPASPDVGLIRFLHLFATFTWKTDILIVNLNKEFSEEDFSNIAKEFTKNRTTLPSMCIATPQDKTGTKWTRPFPTEHQLQRMVLLAQVSLKTLESQILTDFTYTDLKMIFRPPLEHYDVVLHLLKKANVASHQSVDGRNEVSLNSVAGSELDAQPVPVTEFNVIKKFVQDIQNIFRDIAWFFYDPFGGSVIGMVWRPQAIETKDFKTSHFPYRRPAIGETEVISLDIEKESVLDDIRVMGGGIVESIVCPQRTSS